MQTCPLCDRPAPSRAVSAPDGKMIECAACTTFFIDESSEEYLAEMAEITRTERRTQLQSMAQRTPANSVLVIRGPRPDERIGEGPGVATKRMVAESVSGRS